jgi:hypothetical protein
MPFSKTKKIWRLIMTDYAAEINGYANSPELAGPVRLILGLTMMIAGLYFGLFTAQSGQGLGLLSFIASPFVFLTDKK